MTTSLRIFFIGGLTAYRGLINWLSPWIFIPSLVVTPIFQIFLFVYIGRAAGVQSDELFVIGNAIQYASIPCIFSMTHAIAGERYQQTLAYLLVSPAGRLSIVLGRALPVVVNGEPGGDPGAQRGGLGAEGRGRLLAQAPGRQVKAGPANRLHHQRGLGQQVGPANGPRHLRRLEAGVEAATQVGRQMGGRARPQQKRAALLAVKLSSADVQRLAEQPGRLLVGEPAHRLLGSAPDPAGGPGPLTDDGRHGPVARQFEHRWPRRTVVPLDRIGRRAVEAHPVGGSQGMLNHIAHQGMHEAVPAGLAIGLHEPGCTGLVDQGQAAHYRPVQHAGDHGDGKAAAHDGSGLQQTHAVGRETA